MLDYIDINGETEIKPKDFLFRGVEDPSVRRSGQCLFCWAPCRVKTKGGSKSRSVFIFVAVMDKADRNFSFWMEERIRLCVEGAVPILAPCQV
ncbi:hypothetical protein COE76_03170 [Bacillus pseudomycoides]|nr:hypothetical protein CN686_20290 [Bacillus pseudomycoides]PEM64937.1 hypothetical protein CN619_27325 [Bacillus pseudomycoides]PHA48029.1 hypothetical protein COE73_17525 [Bacillus pseudomycoides]PHA66187.1 hypothetical protein COE76_03170 [Bacillus pseudomycoides]